MIVNFFLMSVFPPIPPPLSTPAGAERGANSHIWPTFLRRDVHALLGVDAAFDLLDLLDLSELLMESEPKMRRQAS